MILLGKVLSTHGLRGLVKLKSFTDNPQDIFKYSGSLVDDHGNRVNIENTAQTRIDLFLAKVNDIDNIDDAKKIQGMELFVDEKNLPDLPEDEYYLKDLVGLDVEDVGKTRTGKVVEIYNYGAGDMIEVRWDGRKSVESLPFTEDYIKDVNLKSGRIVVVLPEYLETN